MVQILLVTENEAKLLDYLFRHYHEKLSINGLAKNVEITPKGAYKILKKFEADSLVVKEKIANAQIYTLHFANEKTEYLVKYMLKSAKAPNSYVKVLEQDLQILKEVVKGIIIFGSVLEKGMKAEDIDILVIIDKHKLNALKLKIKEFEMISPKKTHLVIQTINDIQRNLQKNDRVIAEILQKGYIIYGHSLFYEVIKDDANKK
ncbi:MAG: nucleotidyltransferase domain-containing protein [Nanoarchaeota archaeon]